MRFANVHSSVNKRTCPRPKTPIMQKEEILKVCNTKYKVIFTNSISLTSQACIKFYMNVIYIPLQKQKIGPGW